MNENDRNDPVNVGDHVRSYDFPDLDGMKRSCYVEGIIEAVGQVPEVGGPDRYTIRITRRVWKDQEDDDWKQGKEFPTGSHIHPLMASPAGLAVSPAAQSFFPLSSRRNL